MRATLCLVTEEDRILLGYKKRGLGKGLWNGFGGKVESGESIVEAAERELQEEANIFSNQLAFQGILFFTFDGSFDLLEGYVFHAMHYEGIPRETEEMCPQWFSLSEIPYAQMWSDDILWLPLFLKGISFLAYFHFDIQEKLVYGKLRTLPVSSLVFPNMDIKKRTVPNVFKI